MSTLFPSVPQTKTGPAWEIATLFSDQGSIAEGEYLFLTGATNKLVELTDGYIEVLPMPTLRHQLILQFVFQQMLEFITPGQLGVLVVAGLRVKIRQDKFRQPDIMFLKRENQARGGDEFWTGADLVVEVVSPNKPERDLEQKPFDYAEAHIPEYWIVDPRFNRITVLKLEGGQYITHREAAEGGRVASSLLAGFSVDVAAVFAAGDAGHQA